MHKRNVYQKRHTTTFIAIKSEPPTTNLYIDIVIWLLLTQDEGVYELQTNRLEVIYDMRRCDAWLQISTSDTGPISQTVESSQLVDNHHHHQHHHHRLDQCRRQRRQSVIIETPLHSIYSALVFPSSGPL